MVHAVSAGVGIYKPGAGLMRSSSSGSLSGRLRSSPDIRKSLGGVMKAGDARNKITQGKILDARDLLGEKAKNNGEDKKSRGEESWRYHGNQEGGRRNCTLN